MGYLKTFEEFVNENLNERNSFTARMNKETLEIYNDYYSKIDLHSKDGIKTHRELTAALDKDDRVKSSGQERTLRKALAWLVTRAQQMES